jgi:hypothetical protein
MQQLAGGAVPYLALQLVRCFECFMPRIHLGSSYTRTLLGAEPDSTSWAIYTFPSWNISALAIPPDTRPAGTVLKFSRSDSTVVRGGIKKQ